VWLSGSDRAARPDSTRLSSVPVPGLWPACSMSATATGGFSRFETTTLLTAQEAEAAMRIEDGKITTSSATCVPPTSLVAVPMKLPFSIWLRFDLWISRYLVLSVRAAVTGLLAYVSTLPNPQSPMLSSRARALVFLSQRVP
jgi:hypothetical protein